jgi:hypothetical protein
MNKQTGPNRIKEEWRPIPSAPGYLASNEGKIISQRRKTPKVLSPIHSITDHLYVFVDKRKRWVHHLILEAFGFERPPEFVCRHLDGDPTNNNICNLKWGTALENARDRFLHGTIIPPEQTMTPLTREQVNLIKALHGLRSSRSVGATFCVSHVTVQKIWRGERWK